MEVGGKGRGYKVVWSMLKGCDEYIIAEVGVLILGDRNVRKQALKLKFKQTDVQLYEEDKWQRGSDLPRGRQISEVESQREAYVVVLWIGVVRLQHGLILDNVVGMLFTVLVWAACIVACCYGCSFGLL
ncbi:unnamed protein product [Vicia faba]|uniref:Uncharacterized protein n=1 Tax=Vicia faba TaxID=3906 RepID=A0AAV1AZW9_VICFA|nr:unnamed protein product [Vicia faba]